MTSLADDTRWMDATDQAALVASGQVSASQLLEAAIERIERIDPLLNAVVIRWFDHAREVAAGSLPDGPLRGVPFLLKDLWATCAGIPTSSGNRLLRHIPCGRDSEMVRRWKASGAIIVGKTNTPEFALQPATEPETFGPTRNPWDLSRSPAGSSGGAWCSGVG